MNPPYTNILKKPKLFVDLSTSIKKKKKKEETLGHNISSPVHTIFAQVPLGKNLVNKLFFLPVTSL